MYVVPWILINTPLNVTYRRVLLSFYVCKATESNTADANQTKSNKDSFKAERGSPSSLCAEKQTERETERPNS
jgi:hypothetical protein